mmetsp:Transcript_24210/g.76148  ORF Transcript_24210/g.76148 Transcript_24210/m.76148 type:complete len:276 (-) Transcript_24210:4733-5560(-)
MRQNHRHLLHVEHAFVGAGNARVLGGFVDHDPEDIVEGALFILNAVQLELFGVQFLHVLALNPLPVAPRAVPPFEHCKAFKVRSEVAREPVLAADESGKGGIVLVQKSQRLLLFVFRAVFLVGDEGFVASCPLTAQVVARPCLLERLEAYLLLEDRSGARLVSGLCSYNIELVLKACSLNRALGSGRSSRSSRSSSSSRAANHRAACIASERGKVEGLRIPAGGGCVVFNELGGGGGGGDGGCVIQCVHWREPVGGGGGLAPVLPHAGRQEGEVA